MEKQTEEKIAGQIWKVAQTISPKFEATLFSTDKPIGGLLTYVENFRPQEGFCFVLKCDDGRLISVQVLPNEPDQPEGTWRFEVQNIPV
ncbi:MAG: hypothetical protein ACJ8C4_18590 [Gemmataceae bacterium]